MEFIPLLVMSALVKKIVDFVKYAANGDINAVVTQIGSWAAGVAVAFVAANSDFGEGIGINGQLLSALNGWSLALVGFNLASAAGIGWDVIKAVDNTNSAVVPNLMGGSPVRQGVPGSFAPVQPDPRP
jgi:hypothetical protein